jgi:hypothetical protein
MFLQRSAFVFMAFCGTASAAPKVDVALVLAVDVSASIDLSRYRLQRDGFAAAFESAAVVEAIAAGKHGSVAITLVEWAGEGEQRQAIDWTVISDAASANAFAAKIAGISRSFLHGQTSISAAIDYSAKLFRDSDVVADRKVIDVSGDGSNNTGRGVGEARDEAVRRGITINGLAILAGEKMLEAHYQDYVVGGEGSFVVVANDFEAFPNAILSKLVREIVSVTALPLTVARLPDGRAPRRVEQAFGTGGSIDACSSIANSPAGLPRR